MTTAACLRGAVLALCTVVAGKVRAYQPGSNPDVIPCLLPDHRAWPQFPNLLSATSNGSWGRGWRGLL